MKDKAGVKLPWLHNFERSLKPTASGSFHDWKMLPVAGRRPQGDALQYSKREDFSFSCCLWRSWPGEWRLVCIR